MATDFELFISVDVESSGPIPGDFSLLSIGACVVGQRDQTFYAELQPLNNNAVLEALKVTGFDLEQLALTGTRPVDAMNKFRDWVLAVAGEGTPVFVGFNAGFDWSFVNWYFHHFVRDNPFGFAPLDIKSYFMGRNGCHWKDTKSSRIPSDFQPDKQGTHNALVDALSQAEMFEKMRR
jgi:ribonuclease T